MGRVGGGIEERVALDMSLGWFGYGQKKSGVETQAQHTLLAVAANAFLSDHLFVRGGLGVAHGAATREAPPPDAGSEGEAVPDPTTDEESGMSLGFLGGGGIEFFLNSNLAASFTLQFQRHMGGPVGYSGVHGFAGLTWY